MYFDVDNTQFLDEQKSRNKIQKSKFKSQGTKNKIQKDDIP